MSSPFPLPPISEHIESMQRRQEYQDLIQTARKDMYKSLVKAHLKEALQKGTCTDKLLQQLYDTLPRKENSDYKMVTLSAKDGIDAKSFWDRAVQHITTSGYIKSALYCIEQRSQDGQDPYGWHIHILGNFTEPKSKIIEKVYKSFKRFLAGKNYVDVRPSTETRRGYLMGDKCPDKMPKVLRDRELRVQLQIPDYQQKLFSPPNIDQHGQIQQASAAPPQLEAQTSDDEEEDIP